MTPFAAHVDQAVRHAVDAYIDGRFLPTFEGEAAFETRNSRYRLLDGVLLAAPDASLVGAELVGWLVEYPSRSEVVPAWKNGARAVLVDTRNDGIRGPHIVITSATRTFRTTSRSSRPGSAPRLPAQPGLAGSQWPQGGSTMDQGWGRSPAPVAPPAPVSPSWGYYPPAAPASVAASPKTLPPPPPVPSFAAHGEVARRPTPLPPPPVLPAPLPAHRTLPPPPPMVMRPATPPPPPPRVLPRPVPPPADPALARRIEAAIDACGTAVDAADGMPTARDAWQSGPCDDRRRSGRLSEGATTRAAAPPPADSHAPFMLTGARARAHQRGVPLR